MYYKFANSILFLVYYILVAAIAFIIVKSDSSRTIKALLVIAFVVYPFVLLICVAFILNLKNIAKKPKAKTIVVWLLLMVSISSLFSAISWSIQYSKTDYWIWTSDIFVKQNKSFIDQWFSTSFPLSKHYLVWGSESLASRYFQVSWGGGIFGSILFGTFGYSSVFGSILLSCFLLMGTVSLKFTNSFFNVYRAMYFGLFGKRIKSKMKSSKNSKEKFIKIELRQLLQEP
jgi:hypothetical protein